MMKDGKFLVARLEGAGQEPQPEKLLDSYFRYKEYIHNPEWQNTPAEDIWNSKFIGLTDNFKNKPIRDVKILEYQNPAYSAAYNLGGDPRDYNKVFTVQLSGCDYDCSYCYVPKQINIADQTLGKYFSGAEIVDNFLAARSKSDAPMKVIRLSGGNPTIVPEIIIDVYRAIKAKNAGAYLWVDSNLSTPRYMESLGNDLRDILNQKDVGVVGCFKGFTAEDFAMLVGAKPEVFEQQFETAAWFLEQKTDFFVYLPALVYGNVEEKSMSFAKKLNSINKNLALRTEMLEIIDYPGATSNYERTAKLGRPMPTTDQREVFDTWYNMILPQFYNAHDLKKFCCQIPLYE